MVASEVQTFMCKHRGEKQSPSAEF